MSTYLRDIQYFSHEEVNSLVTSIAKELLPFVFVDRANTFVQVLLSSRKICSIYNKKSLEFLLNPITLGIQSKYLLQFFFRVMGTFTLQQNYSEQKVFNTIHEDHIEVHLFELLVYIILVLGNKFTGEVESAWFKFFGLIFYKRQHQ